MSMYGPYRKIVAVGEHRADGTTVTLECGHTWELVSHMHMDARSIGDDKPCGQCMAEMEQAEMASLNWEAAVDMTGGSDW
jgi:hypothetical protein